MITISRTQSKHGEPRKRLQLPWRRIVLGLVAVAVLAGGLAWGVSYWQEAPKRTYIEAIRMSSDPALNAERTDEDIVKIMDQGCDGRTGSLGDSLTTDPQYVDGKMSREEYVAVADTYCASR